MNHTLFNCLVITGVYMNILKYKVFNFPDQMKCNINYRVSRHEMLMTIFTVFNNPIYLKS